MADALVFGNARNGRAVGENVVRGNLEQGFHHEVALADARMRQREHVVVHHVELVVQDVDIARTRAVLDFAHMPRLFSIACRYSSSSFGATPVRMSTTAFTNGS